MEYTVQKLSRMAGISSRTLRYYDEIGLLKPARINSSGYRIYGEKEVERLQHILFYRELGVNLERIKGIIESPDFQPLEALCQHHKQLLEKRKQLDLLIANVTKTIAAMEGRLTMSDCEKFEGFKQAMIDENEKKYGKEVREKYGDDVIETSNQHFKNMTADEYERFKRLEQEVLDTLYDAYKTGNPAGELAQKAADLHKQWLAFAWTRYSKEAHAGLAQMYVDDPRFTEYYDKNQPGLAEFLRDAVHVYTGISK